MRSHSKKKVMLSKFLPRLNIGMERLLTNGLRIFPLNQTYRIINQRGSSRSVMIFIDKIFLIFCINLLVCR